MKTMKERFLIFGVTRQQGGDLERLKKQRVRYIQRKERRFRGADERKRRKGRFSGTGRGKRRQTENAAFREKNLAKKKSWGQNTTLFEEKIRTETDEGDQ